MYILHIFYIHVFYIYVHIYTCMYIFYIHTYLHVTTTKIDTPSIPRDIPFQYILHPCKGNCCLTANVIEALNFLSKTN